MTTAEALRELDAAGTEQNRKVYRRHGVRNEMYGVSFAHLRKLAKRAGTDAALADALWATGNHDARVLATLVADPATIAARTLDQWARDLDNYVVTDAFSVLASKSKHALKKMEAWIGAKGEWVSTAGWNILAHIALKNKDLDDARLGSLIETIERDIHTSRNRVRYAMNSALIAIGSRNAVLEKRALAAARRIGTVHVDHGETGCVTPDAESYIVKTRARARG